jgi:lysosomal alpha-mannosidase
MQKRILNERSYYNLTEYLGGPFYHNVTSNYYPITSAISIKDGQKLFTVMNDRSQGGSSLDPGRIELM